MFLHSKIKIRQHRLATSLLPFHPSLFHSFLLLSIFAHSWHSNVSQFRKQTHSPKWNNSKIFKLILGKMHRFLCFWISINMKLKHFEYEFRTACNTCVRKERDWFWNTLKHVENTVYFWNRIFKIVCIFWSLFIQSG